MKLKKIPIILTGLALASCQTFLPNTVKDSVDKSFSNKYFGIKSSSNNDIVRKSFISQNFYRSKGKPLNEIKKFTLSQDDLKRRFIISIFNGKENGIKVSSAKIKINGKEYFGTNSFNQNISELEADVIDLKAGENTLEVELNSKPDSSLFINLFGFLKPVSITGAVHSLIPDGPNVRLLSVEQGVAGIKFLEGMKVRLFQDSQGKSIFTDLNGTSLSSLNKLLTELNITKISRYLNKPPEELDQREARIEAKTGTDVANLNLFYYIDFDKNKDAWSIIDKIRTLPYIEESYPKFIYSSPSTVIPNDPDVYGTYAANTDWLQRIHVKDELEFDRGNPVLKPGGQGAWSVLKTLGVEGGKPLSTDKRNINKIAILDRSFWFTGCPTRIDKNEPCNISESAPDLKPSDPKIGADTHPDFIDYANPGRITLTDNIDFLDNLYIKDDKGNQIPNPEYGAAIAHGTGVAGIFGATGNNGIGGAGVAYGAQMHLIRSWGGPDEIHTKHKGMGFTNGVGNTDNKIVDSMAVAVNEDSANPNTTDVGAKIILIELEVEGYTAEQVSPEIREWIRYFTSLLDVNVVVPAGNDFDHDISKFQVRCDASDQDIILHCRENANPGDLLYVQTPDTGSVIVGGLNSSGTELFKPEGKPYYNHGITSFDENTGESTFIGKYEHGIDVSSIAQDVWTTEYPHDKPNVGYKFKTYAPSGGTSFASPMVAGTISLMLAVNPNLKPNEIRKVLRRTANPPGGFYKSDGKLRTTAGLLDAYKAVNVILENNNNEFPSIVGRFPLQADPNPPKTLNIQGVNIPVVDNDPNTPATQVHPGDTAAVSLYGDLSQISIKIGGKTTNVQAVVDNYVLFGIPEGLTEMEQDMVVQPVDGTLSITFENALEILAFVSKGIPPTHNIIFPNGDIVSVQQFLQDGGKIKVSPGDIIGISLKDTNMQDARATIDGVSLPVIGIVQNYKAFGIPDGLTPGVKDVVVSAAGGSVTFEQAVEIIAGNGLKTEDKIISSNETNPVLTGFTQQFTGYVTVRLNDSILSPASYIWDANTKSLKVLLPLNTNDRITITGTTSSTPINTGFPNIIDGINIPYGFYFDFSEGAGNTVYDKSGNGNHGLLTQYHGELPIRHTTTEGVTSLEFVPGSFVKVFDSPSYELHKKFTLLTVLKLNQINSQQTLLQKWTDDNSGLNNSFNFYISEDNKLTLTMADNKGSYQSLTLQALDISPGEVIGLGVIVDLDTDTITFVKNQQIIPAIVLYDGSPSHYSTITQLTEVKDTAIFLSIGNYTALSSADYSNELYLKGNLIDSANVFDKALTPEQVRNIFYNMGLRD